MSGAELVAVLSVGASVIQVVDACNKLVDRIKEYRGNAAFIRLRSQLQLFASNIKALEKTTRTGDDSGEEEALLHEVLGGCKLRIEELDGFVTSLVPSPNSSTLNKTIHAVRAFFKDHRVKAILEDLNDYREVILLHICRETEQNTRRLLFLFEEQHAARQAHEVTRPVEMKDPSPAQDHFPVRLLSHSQRRRGNGISCASGDCTCACHKVSNRGWLVKPAARSARCSCSSERYVVSATVLGKSVKLSLGASWASGLSLTCSLKFRNIVDNKNNPGFEVLRQCLYFGTITVEKALAELETLRQNGVIDFNDSTKWEDGYLETVCFYDVDGDRHQSQLRLARFLAQEGVTWKSSLAHGLWSPEGVKLELIRALPPLDNPRLCHIYNPGLYYPDLDGHHRVPADRWWLRAFTQICKSELDMGEYMPFHRAVSFGALDEVERYLKTHSQIDLSENFLGHTVLHLAVQWPSILDLLLKSGYSSGINLWNVHGATPLCYALVYGFLDSITILVEAGAEFPPIWPLDGKLESSLSYAVGAEDEKPLLHLLDCFIRMTPHWRVSSEIFEPVAFASPYPHSWNLEAADYLLSKMSTSAEVHPYHYERDGFNLLHFASSSQHARRLLEYPGLDINKSSNHEGYTPLMIFSWFLDPILLQETLKKGARINRADHRGQTALHCTIKAGFSYKSIWYPISDIESSKKMMETATVLIQAGGDLLQKDNCRCYCSPQGCSPLRALVPALPLETDTHIYYVLILELFVILQECNNGDIISAYIAELDRFQRSDEIGLTYTCCYSSCQKLLKYWPPNDRSCSEKSRFDADPGCPQERDLQSIYRDWAEIRAEEGELGSRLERVHVLFEGHWEDQLVKTLARRCAMMDYIRTERIHREIYPSARSQDLEQSVKDYMTTMKSSKDYMESVIPGYNDERCMQQREKLSNRLIEEYWQLKQVDHKDHDWDVENLVEGPCMESFRFISDANLGSTHWAPKDLS